ncbi:MAG: NAD(P)-dependent oxidoreductase [Bradymonadia bacterium]
MNDRNPLALADARTEEAFDDYKPPYTAHQAEVEAYRCLYCEDAPCIKACPTGIDIPQFIRKIATGNLRGSARTIFESNILGMSCARVCPVEVLCVGDCVYNLMDQPAIQIGKLQRFATDAAFEAGWRYYEAGPDTGKSVGLIGAGPASLAAAHMLRRKGHACTIYDKRDVIGGLNTTGVAPYKMKADRSVEEVAWVLEIGGIDIQTGVEIGKDLTWADLEAKHDALFLGFGLGPDRLLGDAPDGVHGAVDYIEQMKLGSVSLDGVKRAVVLGGGNTAMDAIRELAGLGIEEVLLVYRGSEAKMSGYRHEFAAAKQLGVRALWQRQPVGFTGEGQVTGVTCVRLDDQKQTIDGSEHVIDADLVLLAIGQSKLGDLVSGLDGVEVEWGKIKVGEAGATGRPGVYAGGDCANGGKEVVNAVAEGRDAALAIDKMLAGEMLQAAAAEGGE